MFKGLRDIFLGAGVLVFILITGVVVLARLLAPLALIGVIIWAIIKLVS